MSQRSSTPRTVSAPGRFSSRISAVGHRGAGSTSTLFRTAASSLDFTAEVRNLIFCFLLY